MAKNWKGLLHQFTPCWQTLEAWCKVSPLSWMNPNLASRHTCSIMMSPWWHTYSSLDGQRIIGDPCLSRELVDMAENQKGVLHQFTPCWRPIRWRLECLYDKTYGDGDVPPALCPVLLWRGTKPAEELWGLVVEQYGKHHDGILCQPQYLCPINRRLSCRRVITFLYPSERFDSSGWM